MGLACFYISCPNFTPFHRQMFTRHPGAQKNHAIFLTGILRKLRFQRTFSCAIENLKKLFFVSNVGILRRISLRCSAVSTPYAVISFHRVFFSTFKTRRILSFNGLKIIL